MATEAHLLYDTFSCEIPSGEGLQIGIAVAQWNSVVTMKLLQGAIDMLKEKKANIHIMEVPGTFELTYASKVLMQKGMDAVIAIGCVVRGDTPHFDYICQGVSYGISQLNTHKESVEGKNCPVIFGVLTTNTMEQAEERAGGKLGNKGSEAAETALRMCRFKIENF